MANPCSGLILRADQQQAKSGIYSAIRNGSKRVVLQAMTSFGKTALAASIVRDALAKGVGVIFTAPMITLVDQTAKEFYKFGITDIGIIQADHPLTDFSQPVQICSIQSIASLMKRDPEGWERFQRGRLVIHDEVHIQHKTHKRMNEIADKPVIGLSATPWRKGLGKYYDELVSGPDTGWLIQHGHLSQYRAYSHYLPDMTGVAINASGDYSSSESGEKYEPKVIGDIVGTWRQLAEGRKTILFAPRVADAERFAEEFRQAGVKAVAVSGYMDQDECAAEVERFRDGEITLIASVAKLATGFSVRDVGCIIDAQPTKSLMRHLQKLGRGLRTHENKTDVVILDNAGNLLRNGLPDGDFPVSLDNGSGEVSDRKKQDDPLPKPCPKCHAVKPPKVRECPSCGFVPQKQSELEVEAGELVEMKKAKKANREMTPAEKERFYGGLKFYAERKGYSEGWASHAYRDKTGVWPNHYRDAQPVPPNQDVLNYIKHKQIKYAKSRAA